MDAALMTNIERTDSYDADGWPETTFRVTTPISDADLEALGPEGLKALHAEIAHNMTVAWEKVLDGYVDELIHGHPPPRRRAR